MERTDIDPDDLDRPEWNSLLANYDLHDIGEAYLTGRLHQIGLHVEHWGIDKRHDDEGLIFDNKMDLRLWEPLDGQDESPAVWPSDSFTGERFSVADVDGMFDIPNQSDKAGYIDEDEWRLRGIVDVKTKSSEDWLGKFNLRHLAHYAEWADHYDVPVFLYFTLVDADAEEVGEKNIMVEIPSEWSWETLVDHYDRDTEYDLSYGELKDDARTCSIVKRTFRAPDGNLVVTVDEDAYNDFDYIVENVL
jgi:hypothetical protein